MKKDKHSKENIMTHELVIKTRNAVTVEYKRWYAGVHAEFSIINDISTVGTRIKYEDAHMWIRGLLKTDVTIPEPEGQDTVITHDDDDIIITMKYVVSAAGFGRILARISKEEAKLIADDIRDMLNDEKRVKESFAKQAAYLRWIHNNSS